jgi:hypothetical protein
MSSVSKLPVVLSNSVEEYANEYNYHQIVQ